MANKNIIIYQSHFELMEGLTDEQAGILIKAIGLFGLGKEPNITDKLVLGIFTAIKRDFVIQSENYEKKVKANQENGKKGGRPSKPNLTEDNPQNPMGLLETQPNPQNLKDKDKDKDKEKDIEKEIVLANSLKADSNTVLFRNKLLPSVDTEEFENKFAEFF
jgi:hypothetical protein